VLLFIAGASHVVYCANLTHTDPFATNARFAVDSEAAPSSAPLGQLHPRLSLRSVAATVEPDKFAPTFSLIEIVLYPFPFTRKDEAIARRGDKWPLLKKSDALHNSNPKVSGNVAIVQLTLNEHFQVQQVTITVTGVQGYSITLSDRQFQTFNQECQFDGKKLRFLSKGSYRLGGMPAGVAAFTMNWDLNLIIPVFKKATIAK
jgi:hypothetical protein